MSAWAVPKPVKYVFDSFPLKEYEIPASQVADHRFLQDRKFALTAKLEDDDGSKKSTFQLGVYNVIPYKDDSNVLVPTDPICLSCQLIINLRNGLSFPSTSPSPPSHNDNFISVVSYHAAPDNELPIFIEQGSQGKTTLNSSTLINELQLSRTKPEELMKCLAVDSTLYDFWIITVLFEMDQTVQAEIYAPTAVRSSALYRKVILDQTIVALLTRFGFSNRNKKICQYFTSALGFAKLSQPAETEKCLIISKAKELLSWLDESLQGQEYLIKDKSHAGVLDCKLAAIVYNVTRFAPQSTFGQLLSADHATLVAHSTRVLHRSLQ